MVKDSSKNKKKMTDQEKLDAGYTPISEILKQNEDIKLEKNENVDELLSMPKHFTAGFASSIASTPFGLAALGEAIPRTVEAVTDAAINKDTTLKQELLESLVENKNLEYASNVEDTVRRYITGKSYEELNPNEQLASLSGEILPILATGGSKGLVKVGDSLRKLAIKNAKKEAVKSGKALSSKAIKNITNKTDFATGMLLPGTQITKGAKLGQQLVEAGIQSGIPIGINEATRYGLKQEGILGDYSPKEDKNITIINDKRKIGKKKFIEDLPVGTTSTYTIDDIKADSEEKSNLLKNTALIGACILGSAAATRKIKTLVNKETNLLNELDKTKTSNNPLKLSLSEKSDTILTDRFAFKDKALENGLIKEETANELARDTNSFINAAYNTGDLGDGVKLKVAPQQTYNKLQALKATRPQDYNALENFLEINSKIEDEAHRYNKFINNSKKSTDDYINDVLSNNINEQNTSRYYSNAKKLSKQINNRKKLLNYINNDPQLKEVLQEISEIGNALLTKIEKSGIESAEDIEYLRKNRTINDLFIYKPRVGDENLTLKDRIKNYFINKTPYDKTGQADISERGETFIEKSKNYLDIMESSFKDKLFDIFENDIKVKSIDDMVNGSFNKINEALDNFDLTINNITDKTIETGKASNIKDIIKKVEKDISDLFVARPLGKMRINNYGNVELSEPRSL